MNVAGWSSRIVGVTFSIVALAALAGCSSASTVAPAGTPAADTTSGDVAEQPRPGSGDEEPAPAAELPDGALIVRTGHLQLEVADLPGVLVQARTVVTGLGGYVAASEEVDKGGEHIATITYRVPVERWDEALSGLRGLATRVVLEQTGAEEVTAQVVDLMARLSNLRASETALQGLMERAGSIDDVLAVQSRLTDTRQEIEQLVAQQQSLEQLAALATLTVDWNIPVVAVVAAGQGWDLGREQFDRAAAQTVQAAQGVASFLVWVVVVGIPVVGPLLILGFVAFRMTRRWQATRPVAPNPPRWGPGLSGPPSP